MKKTKTDSKETQSKQPEKVGWQTAGQSEVWRAEKKGDTITGIFVDDFTFTSKKFGNEGTGYKIRTADGMRTLFGTGRLDRLMSEIPQDAEVMITYLGKIHDKNSEKDVHEWKVDYRTSDVPS